MRSFFVLGKYVIIAAILLALTRLVLSHQEEQTKVLVVHAYNIDLAWVNDVNDGINRALDEAGRQTALNVRRHYMDLRNHPDCNFYKNAASDVRFTIDDWKPEVLILVDDLAQALVGFDQLRLKPGTDREALANDLNGFLAGDICDPPELSFFGLDNPATDPQVQIVFAGVNGGVAGYGYDQAENVSGVFEHKNYEALIQTLQALAGAYDGPVNGIMMLNDISETGYTESALYRDQDWQPFEAYPPVNARTFGQWQAAVEEANEKGLLLLIANYQNVTGDDGQLVAPETLVQWTERHARLPVLGANTRFVADGGMMTVAIAGSEQGEVAIRLAMDVLSGDPTGQRVEAKQFLIGMNQSLVRKRDLKLPDIYEAFSREIGTFVESLDDLYMVEGGNGA